MKKYIVAAVAALMIMPAMAQADQEVVETDICSITFHGSDNSGWSMAGGALDCVKSIAGNRAWVLERLGTQIHYYNKATEKLGVDHVGMNGAYWGDVMAARDGIDSLKNKAAQFKQMYQNQNAKVIVMCSDLQAAGTIPTGSEIAEICSNTDTSYAGYAWEDVYGN